MKLTRNQVCSDRG